MFQELSYTFFIYFFSLNTHGKLMKLYWFSIFSVSENVDILIVYSYRTGLVWSSFSNSEFLSRGCVELPFLVQ